MLITKTSLLSGKERTREIPITPNDLMKWIQGGEIIQFALPGLFASDREFLMTGIVDEEWDELDKQWMKEKENNV